MPIFNSPYYEIDKKETKRYAGLRNSDFDEGKIEEACELARLIIKPTGIWEIYDYDSKTQTVATIPPFKLHGNAIRNHLNGCSKVILLAATVGIDIENEITSLFKEGKYSLSLMLDAAATTAVEQNADLMEKAINNHVRKQGYNMKWRFSPGYGDWPIEQQKEMLHLSKGDEIGISLTESLMLEPRKSITAIIGLYIMEESCTCSSINSDEHDCSQCDKLDCLARRLPKA